MPDPTALSTLFAGLDDQTRAQSLSEWWYGSRSDEHTPGWDQFVRACAQRDNAVDERDLEQWLELAYDLKPRNPSTKPLEDQQKWVTQRQCDAVASFISVAAALSASNPSPSDNGLSDDVLKQISEHAQVARARATDGLHAWPENEGPLYGDRHLHDIAHLLLALRRDPERLLTRPPADGRRVLFPTLTAGGAVLVHGFHATSVPGDEPSVFIAAENAFTVLGPTFRHALSLVGPAISASRLKGGPTRLHIFADGGAMRANDAITDVVLDGNSGGAAAAVACHLAHVDTPFESQKWLISAALGEGNQAACISPVGAVIDKQTVVNNDKSGLLYGRFASGTVEAVAIKRGEGVTSLKEDQLTLRAVVDIATGRLAELQDWADAILYDVEHRSMQLADAAGTPRKLPEVYVQVRIARRRIRDAYLENPMDGAVDPMRFYDPDALRGHPEELETGEIPILMDWLDFATQGGEGTYTHRGVILGDPGYGKSWLLRFEARRLAEALKSALGTEGDLPPLPVLVTLTQVAEALSSSEDVPEAIAEALDKQLRGIQRERQTNHVAASPRNPRLGDSARAELLDALRSPALEQPLGVAPQRVVLLLDSLDEVPATNADALPSLWAWLNDRPGLAVWVTSRTVGYTGLPGWSLAPPDPNRPVAEESKGSEVELCSFTRGQQEAFIDKWFGVSTNPGAANPDALNGKTDVSNPRGSTLWSAIESSPQLAGMAQVPLLLTFLCLLGEDDDIDLSALTRAQLYQRVIHRMVVSELFRRLYRPYNGGRRREGAEDEWDWTERVVRDIAPPAFSLFSGSLELFSRPQVKKPFGFATREIGAARSQGLTRTTFDTQDLGFSLDDRYAIQLTHLPLISSVNGKLWSQGDGLFRFVHRTFHEYLAGLFLANFINDRRTGDEERSAGWDEPIYAWQEILNEDGLPTQLGPEDAFTHAWRVVHVPVWQFVAKKAWDPRYKQPLLFLAGQIKHPNDKAELLDIVAFRQGGMVNGKKAEGEEDDLFRHRLALAAQMVPEIVPEGIESWDDLDSVSGAAPQTE